MDKGWIEIFRSGTKASKGITDADVDGVIERFDPSSNPAPIVMGHPDNDHQGAPAFGVVDALKRDGNKLFGRVANVADELVEAVKAKRIVNRSASFWHPNHPSNPTPGKLNFRHLGMLGASSPGIPNMAPLSFSADDDKFIENEAPAEAMVFAAPEDPKLSDFIDDKSVAILADAVIAKLPKTEPKKEFSMTEEELKQAQDQLKKDQDALAAGQSELDQQKADFAADEEKRAKQDQKDREDANLKFAADLVDAGKFPAGSKDDLVTILNALPNDNLEFSGDDKKTPAQALKDILSATDARINFSAATPNGQPQFTANNDDAEDKARRDAEAKQADAYKNA